MAIFPPVGCDFGTSHRQCHLQEAAQKALFHFHRRVTSCLAVSSANIDRRSVWTRGREGLARRQGYTNAEAILQGLSGGGGISKAEARTLIEAGTMAFEADAARERQEAAEQERRRRERERNSGRPDGNVDQPPDCVPEAEPQPAPEPSPWFSDLGDAVNTGVLSTPAETAIRRGLGEPALGVTEANLTQALAGFIPEAATLNADQASTAARDFDLADGIMFCAPDHLRLHNDGWKVTRSTVDGRDVYWLIPPEAADPAQEPIRLRSKSPLKLGSPFRLTP